MLNVAIAVDSAIDHGPQAERVVSAACEEVIGQGRCPLARALRPGTVAAWYAVVRPSDGAISSLRIEFRDRTADGVLIEERVLTFSGSDGEDSRLASAGSVIAALVAAREGSLARAPAVAVAPRPDWSVDLAALFAPAFEDGQTRWGGLARTHLGFWGRPFGVASASAEAHAGNPDFVWWALAAGVGTRVADRGARVNLELGAELVYERTSVSVTQGAAHDSAGQNGWGGRLSVGAVWATWPHASTTFGVQGTWISPRMEVVVADQTAQRVPAATLGLAVGLRYQP